MSGLLTAFTKKSEELQTTLFKKKVKEATHQVGNFGKNSADALLETDAERLAQYIDEKDSSKIFTKEQALKHGVEKIGSKNDREEVFEQMLSVASKGSKKKAARTLQKIFLKKNLNNIIKLKNKKAIKGFRVDKNTFIKKVSYVRNGKTISYAQARNIKTGKIESLKKVLGRL